MPSRARAAFDWLFRNPDTGRVVVAQAPNLPLGLFLAASIVRRVARPEGATGTAVSTVASVGLVWWALEEVVRGDSRFRRLLGAVVLALFVARLRNS